MAIGGSPRGAHTRALPPAQARRPLGGAAQL